MGNLRRYLFSTMVLLIITFAAPIHTMAQSDSTPEQAPSAPEVVISVRPEGAEDGARFEATAEPGETVEFTAVLENFGEAPIKLRTYISDVLPTLNGGLSVAAPDSERTGITTWVTYDTEEFELQPGESILRPIVIQVPEDTAPGQYVNAVVLETVDPVDQSGMIRQFYRKVVTIYVTVPGDVVTDFTLGEPEMIIDAGRAGILIPVQNAGNVRLELEVEYALMNPDGSLFFNNRQRLGVIYMGQETYMILGFVSIPPPGEYVLNVTATERESGLQRTLEEVKITAPEVEDAPAVQPVTFDSITIEPNADPIAFANVSVEINTATDSFPSTRLTLSVFRDGEFVEDFVLAENLAITVGQPAVVTQRYLPATSWESGTYTFSLKLESTQSGTASLLLEEKDVATLEVP